MRCCGYGLVVIVSQVVILNASRKKMRGKMAMRGGGWQIAGRNGGRGGRKGSGGEILVPHIE
jgi:hypothetical protein